MTDPTLSGAHAEGMKQILRLRGEAQMYGARGWSLFQLSHHRVVSTDSTINGPYLIGLQQKQQLAFLQEPMPESEAWLESLNDELPEVQIEKHNLEIGKICHRARTLLQKINDAGSSAYEVLEMVREMRVLDETAITWRQSPNWAFKVIPGSEIFPNDEAVSTFPRLIQLHHDIWIAYEWNYHRTARILLHEQLLRCLERIRQGSQGLIRGEIDLTTQTSIEIIQNLADDILSTVPQMLGDVDHKGRPQTLGEVSKCRGLGGYFLLWPIKVVKRSTLATEEQRHRAEAVFERIRDYTGMKSVLGDKSII
jgi:hypothetical protein